MSNKRRCVIDCSSKSNKQILDIMESLDNSARLAIYDEFELRNSSAGNLSFLSYVAMLTHCMNTHMNGYDIG